MFCPDKTIQIYWILIFSFGKEFHLPSNARNYLNLKQLLVFQKYHYGLSFLVDLGWYYFSINVNQGFLIGIDNFFLNWHWSILFTTNINHNYLVCIDWCYFYYIADKQSTYCVGKVSQVNIRKKNPNKLLTENNIGGNDKKVIIVDIPKK